MLFRRVYHDRLAQAAYLVACQGSHEALIVDPLRDPAPYLDAARQDGVRITMVAETHVHADFVSGAPALAAATGAQLLLSGEGSGLAGYDRIRFPRARWLSDGEQLTLGTVRLDVLHLPGHTPEHVAFVVTDSATSDAPIGLLSGDFLFVGDVGRPDLLERAAGMTGTMTEAAHQLFASLRRIQFLPDFVQLWPGHGAGSACGKALGAMPQSTLGYERLANWALASQDEREFVSRVLSGQPEPPMYFARMKQMNAAGAPPLPEPRERGETMLREAIAAGALIVDVRSASEFAAGHLHGSINVPLGKSFLTWAGSVIPADRDLVLLTTVRDRPAAGTAARQLPLIGFDRVLGVLAPDQLSALREHGIATVPSIPATSFGREAGDARTVLDVRTRREWAEGHVPGALHIPLAELTSRLDEIRERLHEPIAVHCQGGSRSAVAASVLQAAGFSDVSNVTGGYAAWVRAGNRPASDA